MVIDDEFLFVFIMFFFLLFSLLLLIAMINRYTSFDEPDQVIYLDKCDLKTGDLLGVGYSNHAGMFVSSFSNSVWSHTSIVWVDPKDGCVFVLEAAHYPILEYKGMIKINFDIWYSYNCKFILGWKKYSGKGIDPVILNTVFEKYQKNVKLEGFNISWGRFLLDRDYFETKCNKTYTCFEMTIRILHEIGVYKKEKLHCSYFPKDIINGYIPYEKGHSYERVKRFFLTPCLNKLMLLEKYNRQKN